MGGISGVGEPSVMGLVANHPYGLRASVTLGKGKRHTSILITPKLFSDFLGKDNKYALRLTEKKPPYF
jgi:prolyl-tRNA editing enzyme YbaK/EbsC (Cys-tRNA(Pro) deacylase)